MVTAKTPCSRRMLLGAACAAAAAVSPLRAENRSSMKNPHVVFVIGEDEYKSEQTLPPFAGELQKQHGLRVTVLTAQPDPKNAKNIPGLEALGTADLAVFYLRWRELPEEQFRHIRAYLESGKPLVGFRTTTHAFRYPAESPLAEWNAGFGERLFGTPWRHHYGHSSSTDVTVLPEAAGHPILRGVPESFHVRSWLYHVVPLPETVRPLLRGKSVGEGRGAPEERTLNPVAWTNTHRGGRVFYTSMGHPEDFQVPAVRRLLTNGVFWCLDRPAPAE